jgi:hypothetical protein
MNLLILSEREDIEDYGCDLWAGSKYTSLVMAWSAITSIKKNSSFSCTATERN